MFYVGCSRPGRIGFDIREFDDYEAALQAAREAGAVGEGKDEPGAVTFAVAGNEGATIWIQQDAEE
jgi:hypothetical protein